MLSVESQQTVEKMLLDQKLLSKDRLDALKLQAVQKNVPLLSLIAGQHLVSEEELTKIEAKATGVPYVNLSQVSVADEILMKLPKDVATNYMSVPFGRIGGRYAVAMLDPTNVQAADFIARKIGDSVTTFMASRTAIDRVLGQYKANLDKSVTQAIGDDGDGVKSSKEQAQADLGHAPSSKTVQTLVQDAPITRALNTILDYAVQSNASDIHIEPREKELKIRCRVDGILQDTMTLPKSVEAALVSRIKILSNLKIDEHRVPQDGQFVINSAGKEVDLRIAIAPVVWGEQVVIRLLNKSSKLLTLEALGFQGRAFRVIKEGVHQPHGMTLATGPTGSGKSTTLYAVIQEIKDVSINIVTLEDPVEYKMDSINQMQINPDVGLTFASGLRSILRQDPNVVMVGEIRDKETADLAVQAALTGHVVLSTLHTNSASGVLPRLLDMGIEPFLVASTVNTVIGQRLVRRVCDTCREEVQASSTQVAAIKKVVGEVLPKANSDVGKAKEDLGYDNLPLAAQNAYTLYKGKGCNDCVNGYKGRIGIQEVFQMTQAMERLLSEHATTSQVQDQAQKDGMLTMQQDGYLKALVGITTLEEVARVASDY